MPDRKISTAEIKEALQDAFSEAQAGSEGALTPEVLYFEGVSRGSFSKDELNQLVKILRTDFFSDWDGQIGQLDCEDVILAESQGVILGGYVADSQPILYFMPAP